MPRPRRLEFPGTALHIVQRGNDRHACFFDDRDRFDFLEVLREAAGCELVEIHAWVLMSNHIHLLATPLVVGAVSRMMQSIGRCYVRALNLRRKRTGTLWEGRYRSSLVEDGSYVLACYRYIELNPVRAGMVSRAEEYRWSSHAANALDCHDGLTQPHAEYLALADSIELRRERYRAWLDQRIDPAELEAIRMHTKQQGRRDRQSRPRGRPKNGV